VQFSSINYFFNNTGNVSPQGNAAIGILGCSSAELGCSQKDPPQRPHPPALTEGVILYIDQR